MPRIRRVRRGAVGGRHADLEHLVVAGALRELGHHPIGDPVRMPVDRVHVVREGFGYLIVTGRGLPRLRRKDRAAVQDRGPQSLELRPVAVGRIVG